MEPVAYLHSVLGDLPLQNVIRIGRRSDNDLVLKDMTVSEQHAEIFVKTNKFYLKDNSSNGTFVNGVRIRNSTQPILFGTKIKFGRDSAEFILIEKPISHVNKKEIEPRLIELKGWANLILGHDVISSSWAVFNKHLAPYQTRWKIHIYVDNINDLYNIGKTVIPVLKKSGILFKTALIPEAAISSINKYKAFTIDITAKPRNNLRMAMAEAKKIRNVLINLLKPFPKRGTHLIPGDNPVPGDPTGRLFYRYDGNIPLHELKDFSRGEYRPNILPYHYNIKFNEDVFTGHM